MFSESSRISLHCFIWSLSSITVFMTSLVGRGKSTMRPMVIRAMPMNLLRMAKTLSMYQLDTSGKLMSLRVSPVGAVSMITTSYLPSFLKVRTYSKAATISIPGMMAISSAVMPSRPWETMNASR